MGNQWGAAPRPRAPRPRQTATTSIPVDDNTMEIYANDGVKVKEYPNSRIAEDARNPGQFHVIDSTTGSPKAVFNKADVTYRKKKR
jgi:hypothetical protein